MRPSRSVWPKLPLAFFKAEHAFAIGPPRDLALHSIRVLEGHKTDSAEICNGPIRSAGLHQTSPDFLQALFIVYLQRKMIYVTSLAHLHRPIFIPRWFRHLERMKGKATSNVD